MRINELEDQVLKLGPRARARLAEKLLDSLENLPEDENAKLWAEEAERRDQAWDTSGDSSRLAADVLREALASRGE